MSIIKLPSKLPRAELNRRHFLGLMVVSGFAAFSPRSGAAAVADLLPKERSLSLYNPHTQESLEVTYWSGGDYLPEALADINQLMRDYRTGEVKPIDTGLLDLMHEISVKLKAKEPFHVISGYRSRETNEMLRKRSRRVAKNSYHVKAKAADIRLPCCGVSKLRKTAFKLKAGGVGYYPGLSFVHIDVGPFRCWTGARKKA